MTKEEKQELYESIIKKVSKDVKQMIKGMTIEEQFVPDDKLLHRFININPKKLHETYNKNIAMFNKHINEANGEELEPLIDDIASGQSPFGRHSLINRLNTTKVESVKDSILFNVNEYSDFHYLYNFDDWQFIVAKNDEIYYMDMLIPENKLGLKTFLNKLDNLGYHYKIEKNAIDAYFSEHNVSQETRNAFKSWIYIRIFEKTDSNQRNSIRNISRYLCHYTLRSNKEQIRKNGIVARNLSHPNYPKRIFMIVDNRDDIDSEIRNGRNIFDFEIQKDALLNRLVDYRQKEGHQASKNDFIEVVIDIDKLPDDIELHFDQNCYPFAVYTKSDIPADAIIDFNKI